MHINSVAVTQECIFVMIEALCTALMVAGTQPKAKPLERRMICYLTGIALLVPTLSLYAGYWISGVAVTYKKILPDRDVRQGDVATIGLHDVMRFNLM